MDVWGEQGQQVGHQAVGSLAALCGLQAPRWFRDHVCHPKDQPATERSWCEVMATVRIVVQDFRAGVFSHLPEISLPLLANGGQPGSVHPGVVGAVV